MPNLDAVQSSAKNAPDLRLMLMATTDLHAHLLPYNYYTDQPDGRVGLAALATLIEQTRTAHPNTLLIDNGDTLQGTPLGDFAAEEMDPARETHPMIAAMNHLKFDAACLGNHDFNYGLDYVDQATRAADFPVLLANLHYVDGREFRPGSVLLTRVLKDETGMDHEIKIGLIGLAPPQITTWDGASLRGRVTTLPIVETARAHISALRKSGADIVIALCHSGAGPRDDKPDLENALIPLSHEAGLDAIVGGHTHKVLPDPDDLQHLEFGPVPVVQPGFYGSHLGLIDLRLQKTGDAWQVSAECVDTVPLDKTTPADPAIVDLSQNAHRATLAHIRRVIGHATGPLHTYLSMVSPCSAMQLVADAQRGAAAALLKESGAEDLPILAAVAPFKAGGRAGPQNYTDVAAGPLTLRSVADLYVYPNVMQVVKAKGADLKGWLERSACAFNQITPGETDPALLDREFSCYNFDVMIGLTYEIDISKPPQYSADGEITYDTPGRINNLCYDGRPVDPDDTYHVVTNTYRAAGGGHFAAAAACQSVLEPKVTIRDVIAKYVSDRSPIEVTPSHAWRFAPLGGTRVLFGTGPGIMDYPQHAAALDLIPDGICENGYQRFWMTL